MYENNKELLAEIFGYMLGDGWLSYSRKVLAGGVSGDKESLILIKEDMLCIFKDIGKATIFTKETFSYKYNIYGTTSKFSINTKTSKYLNSIGMPIGKRVEQDYSIPDWILNGNKKIQSAFISGYYAAEGFTPSFQKNDKVLKPLGFNLYKRTSLGHEVTNSIINDFSKILDDLSIEYNIKITSRCTKDNNNVIWFIFKNNHKNIIKSLKTIKPKYCINKQNIFNDVIKYYLLKDKMYDYLTAIYDIAINNRQISAKQIAQTYNLTQSQIEGWRSRMTGIKIPSSFPTFTSFSLAVSDNDVHYKLR